MLLLRCRLQRVEVIISVLVDVQVCPTVHLCTLRLDPIV